MNDSPDSPAVIKVQWFTAGPPIQFGLTVTGDLTVEWGLPLEQIPSHLRNVELPAIRLGVVIPAEQVKILRQCLEVTQTIQETLSAKEPEQGAH
jgi:hypothetical protein